MCFPSLHSLTCSNLSLSLSLSLSSSPKSQKSRPWCSKDEAEERELATKRKRGSSRLSGREGAWEEAGGEDDDDGF
ncbi:hypothetical protein Bca101_026332 [Brassica carinata]